MKRLDYFLAAIKDKAYTRTDWIRSVFCIVQEDPEAYKKDPYAYRLIQRRDGYFFLDPNNNLEPTKLTDADITKELLSPADVLDVPLGILPNTPKAIKTTTIGNVLFNAIVVAHPFKDKIDFLEGQISIKKLDAIIADRLVDDLPEGTIPPADTKDIYVHEYLKYTTSIRLINEIADFFVPAASEKTMTPPPGIKEYRKKLVEENKDRLNDPAVLAEIDAKLQEYDRAYYQDDDDAMGFVPTQKSEVRRKLFLTVGAQAGFGDGIKVEHVEKSLSEGTDIDKMPVLFSGSRAGSFNRGHQTMMGGAKFKELIRAASNSKILDEDCGTNIGAMTLITKDNAKLFLKRYYLENGKTVHITEENIDSLIGKTINLRSPRYCKAEHTDYCRYCVGDDLALQPKAVATAVADIGSAFLTLFLKKMHVSGLATAKLDLPSSLS